MKGGNVAMPKGIADTLTSYGARRYDCIHAKVCSDSAVKYCIQHKSKRWQPRAVNIMHKRIGASPYIIDIIDEGI